VTVLPVGADAKQANRFHLVEIDLVVGELTRAGELPWQASLAGTFGAWTAPTQQLEVVGGLVPVRPLDAQEAARPVGENVEGPLAICRVADFGVQLKRKPVRRLRRPPAGA
jgi:hypothetical protein